MKTLRDWLVIDRDSDAGLSLVEVVVAMMIFAMLSTGLLYSMISVVQIDGDSRARQVAANLAAEEIDRAREVEDILKLVSWSTEKTTVDPQDSTRAIGPVKLNGDVFHIDRHVEWVSDSASNLNCGASTAGTTLRYKRVNVTVRWDGMPTGSDPVRSDSVVNPSATVNDPSKGTILVSVQGLGGVGVEGVTITSTPALATAPKPTDEQGCTYAFRVAPGTYKLQLSKAGFVDNLHKPTPERTVTVVEGKVENWNVQYGLGVAYEFKYDALGGAVRPNDLDVSFVSTGGIDVRKSATNKNDRLMHPGSGYQIVAGEASKCPAANPANWKPAADGSKQIVEPVPFPAEPGTTVNAQVPMGVIRVDSSVSSDEYIRIVSDNGTPSVHPACTATVTYNYDKGRRDLAVPYGSWKFYRVLKNGTQIALNNGIVGAITGSAGVVVIDPRVTP